ncbi:sensor histidine kinase [Desertibaculum subflavum]|uniref:sensor histidine kinase n=1 Tax=Desertibaculum subflavum TaxID=2268458 RepID=UPI000E670957
MNALFRAGYSQRMTQPFGSRPPLAHWPWAGAAGGVGWLLLAIITLTAARADGGPAITVLLLPAIVIAGFVGGAWPAALVAALAVAAAYLVAAASPEPAPWPVVAAFAAAAAAIAAAMGSMHRTIELLRNENQAAQAALALRQTLFQDLRHRIANTVQFAASLLRLQRRQIGDDPDTARAALDTTIHRLEIMSRIHRNLYDPAGLDRGFEEMMRAICQDLLTATDTVGVKCTVQGMPPRLSAEKTLCLMLIVTETMINSLKHAFERGTAGSIAVQVARLGDGHVELSVRDNGSGLPAGFDPAVAGGLGLRLIRSLAQQLGGEVSVSSDGGTITRVVFPA